MNIDSTKQFLHHAENCFNILTWQEITANRRILLCSITRPQSKFISTYVQQLNLWAEMYQSWGVDQVYLITTDEKINFLWVNNLSRSLSVLGDVGNEFVAELGQLCQLEHHTPKNLTHYWNYQALINCGQLEKIYSHAMDNLCVTVLKDTKDINLVKHVTKTEHLHLTPYFLRSSSYLTGKILYYKLHPNTELKNYLLTTAR